MGHNQEANEMGMREKDKQIIRQEDLNAMKTTMAAHLDSKITGAK